MTKQCKNVTYKYLAQAGEVFQLRDIGQLDSRTCDWWSNVIGACVTLYEFYKENTKFYKENTKFYKENIFC